jgi:small subunit ribosomal protein S20
MATEEVKGKKERRPQALKRALQSEKIRLRNKAFRSSVRTAVRQFDDSLVKNQPAEVKETLGAVYSLMDKGVKKGVFTSNKAARTKSRLSARLAAKAST